MVVVARLGDAKLASKLAGMVGLPGVDEVAVVRRAPLPMAGVRSHCPPAWLRGIAPLAEAWRLLAVLLLCARERQRTFAVAFFLITHALYIEVARRLWGVRTVPVSISQMDLDVAFESRFMLRALHAAHAVGVRGRRSAERVARHGVPRERIFSPPNVYLRGPFRPQPDVLRDLDAIYVGSLVPVKRLDLLLEAWRSVSASRPAARLAIVGDGELRKRLEAEAARLGIAGSVVFAGEQEPEQVARWLNRGRLFVMTSEAEGLPMAMIEAMSCGLPVVVPDVGEIGSVARNGENAWLVSPGSADGFADALSTLLKDDGRRASLAAGALATAARFESEYSIEAARAAWRRALGV